MRVEIRLLGPLEVMVDGTRLALGGAKPRAVLALLALEPGRVTAATRLAEALWGEETTDKALNTLQVHVSNLRRTLAPASEALGGGSLIETRPPGYVLDVPESATDLGVFEQLVRDGRAAADAGQFESAATVIRQALDVWRGRVLDVLSGEVVPGELAKGGDGCLPVERAVGAMVIVEVDEAVVGGRALGV